MRKLLLLSAFIFTLQMFSQTTIKMFTRETVPYYEEINRKSKIDVIERHSEFIVLEHPNEKMFKISYNNKIGYISTMWTITEKELERVLKYENSAEFIKSQKDRQNREKIALIERDALIKKFGSKYGNLVFNKQVTLGMNKHMVRSSWGSPETINKSTYSWGTTEQWVYSNNRYVYFKNNTVNVIQE